MFYWAQALGRWVEVPTSTDMANHLVTWSNMDVSAFINQNTPVALMG